MPIGMLFWIIMVIWFILGIYWNCPGGNPRSLGGHFIVFVLFFLVGWKVFGFVVQ